MLCARVLLNRCGREESHRSTTSPLETTPPSPFSGPGCATISPGSPGIGVAVSSTSSPSSSRNCTKSLARPRGRNHLRFSQYVPSSSFAPTDPISGPDAIAGSEAGTDLLQRPAVIINAGSTGNATAVANTAFAAATSAPATGGMGRVEVGIWVLGGMGGFAMMVV